MVKVSRVVKAVKLVMRATYTSRSIAFWVSVMEYGWRQILNAPNLYFQAAQQW